MRIIFSPSARRDLKEIIDFISAGSVFYAKIEKQKIIKAINNIPLQPLAGRIVPEQGDDKLREVIFRNYRIMYDIVSATQINIITIHHHSRSLSNNPGVSTEE